MTAFHDCSAQEAAATEEILTALKPVFSTLGLDVQRIVAPDEQRTLGDVRLVSKSGKVRTADLKAEHRASPNIFFETSSNMMYGDLYKEGWGISLKANSLWYWFGEAKAMAILDLRKLQVWLWATPPGGRLPRLFTFREVPQQKHAQRNLTVGRVVPFRDMPKEVFGRAYLFLASGVEECTPEAFVSHINQVVRTRDLARS